MLKLISRFFIFEAMWSNSWNRIVSVKLTTVLEHATFSFFPNATVPWYTSRECLCFMFKILNHFRNHETKRGDLAQSTPSDGWLWEDLQQSRATALLGSIMQQSSAKGTICRWKEDWWVRRDTTATIGIRDWQAGISYHATQTSYYNHDPTKFTDPDDATF